MLALRQGCFKNFNLKDILYEVVTRLFYVNKLAAKLVATKHNLAIFVVGVITVIVACGAILLLGLISSAVLALTIC